MVMKLREGHQELRGAVHSARTGCGTAGRDTLLTTENEISKLLVPTPFRLVCGM
jgi:hypothetical protein